MKKFLIMAALIVTFTSAMAFANDKVISTMYVVECNQSITLRDAPSIYANELAQIPLGERVGVYPYYETDEFYCVKYRGVRGYVLKTYLRVE